MTDEHPKPQDDQSQPEPGPTRRLEKAIDDMATGDFEEGTLMSIEAHTGEHAIPPDPEPSVTEALRNARKPSSDGPDIAPAATMYEPTKPGQVTGGSASATAYGPTGTGTPHSGSVNAGSAPRPVAPFGGKIVVGTRVGQIEISGVLGKGGMGEVFKGYHHALDINVAVKVLPDELSRNELVRQRFLREARLCVKLDHPHVVRVYNVDEYAGNLFLVMEMIEGTDAAHMLKNGGRFRYKRALEIGAASAEALAYAHTQGLVHRDVKPHNILLGASDGKIKISDFGLARAATSSSHLTMSGQIMGTPHYMSPEQAESKEVSDKSDVYSLGVTLYHMLTGETPFVGDTPISVAVQHIAKEIIYPEIRFKPFPKELVAVLKRMTAKDAAKRCNAKQAAVWLRKLIAMAPQDDIVAGDDQAMNSMAPVVRESQAFEQAANERRQRDEHARELARTMLATMQEDSGRRAAVPQTMQEATPVSVVAAQPQKSGISVAAVLLVLVLLGGGGAAAWYFTLGPGAGTFGAGNQPIAGDTGQGADTGGKSNPGDTGGGTGGATGGTGSNTGGEPLPGDTGGNDTGGNDTGGGDTGGSDTGGGDTGGSDTGGSTTGGEPPPNPTAQDDPAIANYLAGGATSIAGAATLADLDAVKSRLDQAQLEFRRGRGSQRQHDEYKDLYERYESQYAYLASTEGFAKIRAELDSFDRTRSTDLLAAIQHLNAAVRERDSLEKLKTPADVAELLSKPRDELFARVASSRDALWDETDSLARGFENEQQYAEARDTLTILESITNTPEKTAAVALRRRSAVLLGQHKSIRDAIQARRWDTAAKVFKETEATQPPENLVEAQKALRTEVLAAFETAHKGHSDAARAAADKAEFDAARTALDEAAALPDQTDAQIARVADMTLYVDLSEQLHLARVALNAGRFTDAKARLTAADALLEKAVGRNVPANLSSLLASLRSDYDAGLEAQFNTLMEAAAKSMEDRDFSAAGRKVTEASALPLTPDQSDRLKEFRNTNEKALEDYVRGLIADVETALDSNEFEKARDALAATDSLTPPKDLEPKLAELRARFAEEAARRHDDLLAGARKALDDKDYALARKSLDDAARVPVDEARATAAAELDTRYRAQLASDVEALIMEAESALETDDFTGARTFLDQAADLARRDDELNRLVNREREQWAAAVEARLDKLLEESDSAVRNKLWKTSANALKAAQDLPLEPEQVERVSAASDARAAAMEAERARLFKLLEDCVKRGAEAEGEKIIEKILELSPTTGDQVKVRKLREELKGETEADRLKRLPRHLNHQWDDRYCKAEQLFDVGEEVSALGVTDDGKFACVGTASGKVTVFNLRRGTTVGTSRGGTRKITAVGIAADGSLAASVDDDGSVVLFDLTGATVQAQAMPGAEGTGVGLMFSPDGNYFYTVNSSGLIVCFNARLKSRLRSQVSGVSRAFGAAMSPDGKYMAVGGNNGAVAVLTVSAASIGSAGGKPEVPGRDNVQRVAFSADSKRLVAGSIDSGVAVWTISKLAGQKDSVKPDQQYEKLSEWVRGVGFSADGKRVVAFDTEVRLAVWKTEGGGFQGAAEYESRLKGTKRFFVTAGVVAPDGTVLMGTREGEIVHLTTKSEK